MNEITLLCADVPNSKMNGLSGRVIEIDSHSILLNFATRSFFAMRTSFFFLTIELNMGPFRSFYVNDVTRLEKNKFFNTTRYPLLTDAMVSR